MATTKSAEATPEQLAVEVRAVQKVYGPTVALAGAELEVRAGEIHGLLGENGAGKSTLVRILAGVESPDSGSVRILGEEATGGVSARYQSGAAFIHQDLGLFPDLTVTDTIALVGGYARRLGLIDRRGTIKRVAALLDRLGIPVDPLAAVGELTLADQTTVAVARALSRGVRLIVLDEPTAYLEARQAQQLFALLSRLRADGVACLVITHRAEDVLTSCDRLTVLRNGVTVASRSAAGLTKSELVRLITGHEPAAQDAVSRAGAEDVVLECRNLRSGGVRDVSFELRAGEKLGVCGLADSGHFGLGETLFGIREATGEIRLEGRPIETRSPLATIEHGLAYVPRDRARDGLAQELTARENILMRPLQAWYRPLRGSSERSSLEAILTRFMVRPPESERQVSTFSGGNQQKILLAKWLGLRPRVLVLNEPTAGVDLGARAEIHQLLRDDCAEYGIAIIVISSDFTEIAELCDRAIVMRHGRVEREVTGDELTGEALLDLAYGGTL